MRAVYICTSWCSTDLAMAAVASLPHDFTSVVVVNGVSGPEEEQRLRQEALQRRNLHVLFSRDNTGFFAGLNVGLRYATALSDWDVAVIGNDDLLFPPDIIQRLHHFAPLLTQWPVVSPAIIDDHGRHQNPHVAFPIGRARRLAWEAYYSSFAVASIMAQLALLAGSKVTRPEVRGDAPLAAGPIEQGYGAAYLVGRAFFESLGTLPAVTFLMQEEFFLTECLSHLGTQVYFDPYLEIRHRSHSSTSLLPSRQKWEISRQSHRAYRRYRAMSRQQQWEMLVDSFARPRPEPSIEVVTGNDSGYRGLSN